LLSLIAQLCGFYLDFWAFHATLRLIIVDCAPGFGLSVEVRLAIVDCTTLWNFIWIFGHSHGVASYYRRMHNLIWVVRKGCVLLSLIAQLDLGCQERLRLTIVDCTTLWIVLVF